ncbi:hypothetical protein REPUB_Repub09cG0095000 [Reevesia pubescens]
MAFTVFVNNLPDKANSNWLATVFQSFGKVLDVFIPEKRSRWGRRFGFVMFETIWEAKRAIWNLNGVFFLENKIGVNMARVTPRNMFWKKVVGNSKSFVSKLTAGKDEGMRTQRADQIGNDKHKSCLQVLMNTENTTTKVVNQRVAVDEFKDKGVCMGKVDNENLLWLQRSLIGYYKGSADEETMKIEVEKEAGKEVTIRRYSGNDFLITFDQVDSMEAARLEGQSCYDIFNKALVGTQPCEGSSVQSGNGYNISCEDEEEGPNRFLFDELKWNEALIFFRMAKNLNCLETYSFFCSLPRSSRKIGKGSVCMEVREWLVSSFFFGGLMVHDNATQGESHRLLYVAVVEVNKFHSFMKTSFTWGGGNFIWGCL